LQLFSTTHHYDDVPVTVKSYIQFGLNWEGIVDFSDISVVLTGAVFLIGFMLSGVMSDYKESEKLPGELACALEGLEDNLLHAAAAKPALDPNAFRAAVRDLATKVRAWLLKQRDQQELYEDISRAQTLCFDAEKAG